VAIPTYLATGVPSSSSSAMSVALPTAVPLLTDDILLLLLATSNEAIDVDDENGGTWTEVTNSPQGIGTPVTATATRLTVFWSRYNGTQGAPHCTDSGDVNEGVILAFRHCATTGNPWDVTTGGTNAVSSTALVIPGGTTTVNNCLIVAIAADSINSTSARLSGRANATLTNVSEKHDDGTTIGTDVGLVCITGNKDTAGAYGNTTGTYTIATVTAYMTIALKPDPLAVGQPTYKRWGGVPGAPLPGLGRATW
jgi:hypothetical protein